MSEATQEVTQEQIVELRAHVDHAFRELSLLREELRTNTNSRRGLPGIAGPKGDQGERGTDAVVKVFNQDGKLLVELNGTKVAEVVSVPGPVGPKGDKGDSIVGPRGEKGDAGVAPSLSEIVREVLKHLASRLS